MKKLLIIAFAVLSGSVAVVYSQSACEINHVHTNPDPAYVRPTLGSGQPWYRTNHFDWKAPFWPIRWPGVLTGFIPPGLPPNPDYVYIVSPFFDLAGRLNYLSKDLASDFHPRDGWELLAMDFGMENAAEPISRTGVFQEGYLFLYNRYTSTIRALMAPWDDDNVTSLDMKFELEPRSEGGDASGLFAGTGGVLKPLDQKSPTRTVSARIAPAPGARGSWAHADIPVFYDPCSCTNDQRLVTQYATNTSGEISLYGLYAGTISTLYVAEAGYALPFPQDPERYLATLNTRDPLDIRHGSVVAKDMAAHTNNYRQLVESFENRNTDLLSDIFGVVSLLGDAAGLGGVKTILGVSIASVVKGLGIASKSYSKLVKPSGNDVQPEHYLPSYTQGEIMLGGSFSSLGYWEATGQDIALPGTPWTLDVDEVSPFLTNTKPQYPLYNETLGLFAILHAPKVKVRTGSNTAFIYYVGGQIGFRRDWRQYQFEGELDYVWNPASHVDVENTRIHAALLVEQSIPVEGPSIFDFIGSPYGPSFCTGVEDFHVINGERLYDSDVTDIGAESSLYATEFVGLECLPELPLTIDRSRICTTTNYSTPGPGFRATDSIFIRLVMDVRYKPNEYGVRNRATIIYTLPVEIVEINEWEDSLVGNGMPTYAENLTVSSIIHTNTYDVFAHSTITINGNVSTDPTTNVASYVAGEEIVVQGSSTIGINTRLAIDHGVPCGKPRIAPYTGNLNTFCTSDQYKAKTIDDQVRAGDDSQPSGTNTQSDDRLYARIEMGLASLEVVSERTDDPVVVVSVYDVIGSLVSTAYGTNAENATTRTMVDTSRIVAGAYIIIVSSGGRQTSLKILYTP